MPWSPTVAGGVISSPAALGYSGAFTIIGGTTHTGTATPVTVNITPDQSLSAIVTAINNAAAVAGTSGLKASVNASNQLEITTGNSNNISFAAVTGLALASLGIPAVTGNGAVNQAQVAQGALMTVDGVAGIQSTSNTVTNVLGGVTLSLSQASANTTVTLAVANDQSGTITASENFTAAYNSWQSFVQQNEATQGSGEAAAGAILFGDSDLRDASLQVDSSVTALVGNLSLADIGITLNNQNILQVDTTLLGTSLSTNYQGVSKLFQASLATDSFTLQPLGSNYSSFAGTFSLGVSMSGGAITGLQLNGQDTSAFNFSGTPGQSYTITGAAGTPYAGMAFSYNGTGGTVTVTATQGVAHQVYGTANKFANPLNGTIQGLMNNLRGQDLSLTSQYNTIINNANSYTDFLLQQYAQLSREIQTAGQQKTTLLALFSAQTNGGRA